ncbi:MAG: TIGR02449 family protein [Gammaproteobacteria bacterium]|nr:TIGR02449 family protein [Gammaproteobacteria bacterium]MDE0440553.1 TIGR02449 family protein [Gammaproteobacteria bacterium]
MRLVHDFTSALDQDKLENMLADDLNALEAKVGELIALCESLANENRALRDRNRAWAREKSNLVERNELARSKIDALIDRLKSMDVAQLG